MIANVLAGMVTPTVETEHEAQNYARFVIAPLERGYGVTLGNALRRVLLSSLPGAAVTSIRLTGVMHEFSAIPGVREDVLALMLQLKKLRVRLHSAERAHLYLDVRGEGEITAADIIAPPEVEVVNPDLYLFTIDDPEAHVEMEIVVERGRGFSPAEERSRSLAIGDLAVDAIFSPVYKVNFEVGAARVGQKTNYDRLVLEIWTDGTVAPRDALQAAAHILAAHFQQVGGLSAETPMMTPAAPEEESRGPEQLNIPIEDLNLSVRVFNALKRSGVDTVGDVLRLLSKGPESLLSIRNFGAKSLDELKEKLKAKGYLSDETPGEAEEAE